MTAPRKRFRQLLCSLTGRGRGQLAAAAGWGMLVLLAIALVQDRARGQQGAAEQEIARRQGEVQAAEAMVREGDLLYAEGLLAEALMQYRAAALQLRAAPMYAKMREIALSKYERVAVERSQELVEAGRLEDAAAVLKGLFEPQVGSVDWRARQMLERLEGEGYFNPAITPEQVQRVSKVEALLLEGDNLIGLGDYDGASIRFAQVLAYDSYNTAARRGLERIDNLIASYGRAAYDQHRATAIREITEQWETKPVFRDFDVEGIDAQLAPRSGEPLFQTRNKLDTIVFPAVEFTDTSLQEVVEYLTVKSRDLDTIEPDPARKGVNIIINPGAGGSQLAQQARVTLKLRNLPLSEILRYVSGQVSMKVAVDAYVVSLVPLSGGTETLVLRTWKVPPTFLSGGRMEQQAEAADPFAAPAAAGASDLAPKLTARAYLANNGIEFPPGASAQFVPQTSTLIVRNTAPNIELIDSLVAGSQQDVPRQVFIKVRLLNIAQNNLQEMGFDWLLAQFNLPGNDRVFGAGGTLGSGTTANNAGNFVNDFPFVPPNGAAPVGQFPVTGGLRQGNTGLGDPLTDLLAADSGRAGGSEIRAPGIFALSGVFTDPQFQVVLRALSQQKGVDIISVPSVVTRSGQVAQVKSVREFIYPTEYDPPELPTGGGGGGDEEEGVGGLALTVPVTPATPTAFETRELGSILDVEPIIGPDGVTVELNLTPELSEFLGFINYGSPIQTLVNAQLVFATENEILMPVFQTIRETTNLAVYDGQTVVMGGLMEDTSGGIEDQVPMLGKLPVVGRLFQSRTRQSQMRAIVLFVTVRIIDPSGTPVNDI